MPARSRASSEATRTSLRAVSRRRRNERAGGRLRRTSRSGSSGTKSSVGGAGRSGRVSASGTRCGNGNGPAKLRREIPFSGADERGDAGLLDGPLEPLPKGDLGLPAQQLASERDVGLADLRVVGGERFVHDLRPRAGDVDDRLGELEQGEL